MSERQWYIVAGLVLLALLAFTGSAYREQKMLRAQDLEQLKTASATETTLRKELSEMQARLHEEESNAREYEEQVNADGSRHVRMVETSWKQREEELTSKHALELMDLRQQLASEQEKVRTLTYESQKPAERRWGLLASYSFMEGKVADVGAGFHAPLGPVEVGVYALNPPAAVLEPKLALNVRF